MPFARRHAKYLTTNLANLQNRELQSIRKTRSALRTAACKYLTSVPIGHSLPETMLLFSMELLRLIGSQHKKSLLSGLSLAISDYTLNAPLMST